MNLREGEVGDFPLLKRSKSPFGRPGTAGGITDKSLPTVGFETIMGAAGDKVGDKWLDGLAGVGGSGFWSETGISFMANSMGDQPSQGATVVGEWLHNEKTSNKNGTPSESE